MKSEVTLQVGRQMLQAVVTGGLLHKVGDHVVIEGDRGIDLGKIVALGTHLPDDSDDGPTLPSNVLRSNAPSRRGPPRVIRHASSDEVGQLKNLARDAEVTVGPCQAAVDRMKLPLKVVDAQYQFDRKKLTFFYDSNERVDFRDLLHDMYQLFKCRIWMAKADEQMAI